MRKIALIVPCYDEARRFDPEAFAALASLTGATLLFVNDGSRDDTEARLRSFCERPGANAELMSFARNRGKGESVREGLRAALHAGAEIVGYLDADLATPADEVVRLAFTLSADGPSVVLGSRVRVLGSAIERSALRHYGGRVFATLAALILGVPVYDTQCGAKLFRRTRALEVALAEPFLSRWCFDVELLGRLLIGAPGAAPLPIEAIRELPLARWRHREGSKIGMRHAFAVLRELAAVSRDISARRQRVALEGST